MTGKAGEILPGLFLLRVPDSPVSAVTDRIRVPLRADEGLNRTIKRLFSTGSPGLIAARCLFSFASSAFSAFMITDAPGLTATSWPKQCREGE